MQPPTLSIIVPTHNRADLLGRALASVFAQSYSDFELFVVDDSSTPQTIEQTSKVVASFADPRLRYVQQTDQRGVSNARNLGIGLASGEYLVFIDDDDTIEPTFLAEVYTTLSQSPRTVGFLWTAKRIAKQTTNGIELLSIKNYDFESNTPIPGFRYLLNTTGGSNGLAVRSSALQEVGGFNPEFDSVEDTDLLLRLCKRFDFIVIPQPLYTVFRHSGERLSTHSLARAHIVERALKSHEETFKEYPLAINGLYKTNAKHFYEHGDPRSGRRNLLRAIRSRPLKWKYWVLLLLLEIHRYLPAFARRKILAR